RNTPIEVLEARSGMFFERFEIAMDSAGAGKFRGGCGSIREIRFISPGEFLSVIKKTKTKPWALNGGLEPNPSQVITYPGTDKEQYVSTKRISVEINDRVIIKTAGGGGHGDPKKRDPERIKSDVLEGYVSAEKAMEIYGVNLGDGEMK
nr:hydantoinase B/oxoprolinase family protein [Actinomycetota bacterium]